MTPQAAAPIPTDERIEVLDTIRGFALFAIGFTIQLGRLEAREPERATRIYLRRLFWLFVFGVVHACVFWAGDVLHMYALLGLLLLALRRVPDRAIVALIVLCLLYPTI